jgi:tRNA threonylcarbamoyladenosine biosynthesis protein TsaB
MSLDDEASVIAAWDTCTVRGALAVARGGKVQAEEYFEAVKGHTGWLMPQLDRVVRILGMEPGDIDLVATGVGPGTFTGVKVGISTAKAVALGLGIPLAAVPTLDVLARQAHADAPYVIAAVDARRGQFYAAVYRLESGGLERLTGYLCLEPSGLLEVLDGLGVEEAAFVGEVPGPLLEELSSGVRLEEAAEKYPTAEALVGLAVEMARVGDLTDAVGALPVYLKEPV